MQVLVSAALAIVGVIHLLPITGLFGQASLNRLYGTTINDPNLLILMQHRAVLFGIIGGLILYSIFERNFQSLAIVVGLVSTISFILIAWFSGEYNSSLSRVVIADLVVIVCLIVAALIKLK